MFINHKHSDYLQRRQYSQEAKLQPEVKVLVYESIACVASVSAREETLATQANESRADNHL